MVRARVGKWNTREKRFVFDGEPMELGSNPGLEGLTQDPLKVLDLIPRPEVMKATGKTLGSITNYFRKHSEGSQGVRLSRSVFPPEGRQELGKSATVYYSYNQAHDVVGYYRVKSELEQNYTKLSNQQSKEFFGQKSAHFINRWLRDLPGEKDQDLASMGLDLERKSIYGVDILVFKEQTPVYLLPKKLVDNPEKLREFASKIIKRQKMKKLPSEYEDYGLLSQILTETGRGYKDARKWLEEHDAVIGVSPRDTSTKKMGGKKTDHIFLVKPDNLDEFLKHLTRDRPSEDMITEKAFSQKVGIETELIKKWLREKMRGSYDEEVKVYDIPIAFSPGTIYVKNPLTQEDCEIIKREPKPQRLDKLDGILSEGMKLNGDRRDPYHPEVRNLLDQGLELADLFIHSDRLREFGIKLEKIPPIEGSEFRKPTYKLIQK